jgi:colanic acid biosynthesis glycosyl transferase WcaI
LKRYGGSGSSSVKDWEPAESSLCLSGESSSNVEPRTLQAVAKNQRIWIVSELYYPEMTSTGYFLTLIAEGLASAYDVSALCGQPSYWARGERAPSREKLQGVNVRRCWATTFDKNKLAFKIINLLTISSSIFWAALVHFRRGDIVIVVTNPPLLPYLTALACRLRRASFVLLIHDVYPEIFTRLGILKPQSIFARLLDRASRWLYNRARRIVVLGRDMRVLAADKLTSGLDRIVIATHWGDTEAVSPHPRSKNRLLDTLHLEGYFVAQFCGNIGRTHGIEDLVSAAEYLASDPDFHFLLIGWGAKKRWALEQKKARRLENLTILDPLPREELCDGLNACDIAIISFSGGMSGISVPSRMYNVLSAGKPLLAVCDDDSELAAVVREEVIGWVIPPGRPDLMVAALREAKADPNRLRAMGERARKAAETKYTSVHVIEVYKSLIEGLQAE